MWGTGTVAADHENSTAAAGMLLVAATGMRDPRFRESVVLLIEHSAEGTIGVIINKQTQVPVSEAFPELKESNGDAHKLFFGGPVEPASVMYLHSHDDPRSGKEVVSGVQWGASYDVLGQLLGSEDESSLRIFFGYAGWGPGQLEFELSLDDWLLLPASSEHIFKDNPDTLWNLLNGRRPGVMARHGPASPEQQLPSSSLIDTNVYPESNS